MSIWFVIILFIFYVLYQSGQGLSEKYKNYANANLWPFDRILMPIHYWLSGFYPSAYTSWNWHPHFGPGYYRPPGPWFQLTHY